MLAINWNEASKGHLRFLGAFCIFELHGTTKHKRRRQRVRKIRGFTLIELMTVIFMIAVLSAFAVPGIISWRSAAKLRGAAENLKGHLEYTKMRAIQENGPVAVLFYEDAYQIFVDTGGNPSALDDEDVILKRISLTPGIKIDFAATTFNATDDQWPKKTRFFGRSTAAAGTVVLKNEGRTKGKAISVSNLGKITLKTYNF